MNEYLHIYTLCTESNNNCIIKYNLLLNAISQYTCCNNKKILANLTNRMIQGKPLWIGRKKC